MSASHSPEGQTIPVTEATGGIGRALVLRIAELGGHSIIHFAHNRQGARDLISTIKGKGTLVQADLSTMTGTTELWKAALDRCDHIDALVNNAGIRTPARVEDDLDAWQDAWDADLRVNLLAPADLCRLAIRHFGKLAVVQINGKLRHKVFAAPGLSANALLRAVKNDPRVSALLEGK